MERTTPEITAGACYLCGEILANSVNFDHVPPRQFHAESLRKAENLSQLLTIKVHEACNASYRLDEEYFVHTLMPFVRGSLAGDSIYQGILGKYRRGKNVPLVRKVLGEVEPRPGGLILPGGKAIKRFNGARLQRIAWKIVRGLYFHHHGRMLPAGHTTWVSLTPPGQRPPEHFQMFTAVSGHGSKGRYPGIFDYRFDHFTENAPASLHYWALLLWDRIIITVLFHDPGCGCPQCLPAKAAERTRGLAPAIGA